MIKAIIFPSGLQLKLLTPVFTSVILSASPPRREMRYRLLLPSRLLMKATWLPSGLHLGLELFLSPCVNGMVLLPSILQRKIWFAYSLRSSVITAWRTVYNTFAPSGETRTLVIFFIFMHCSGLQYVLVWA